MVLPEHRLSSFSILLIMCALMIVGASMIPLLNIQYVPASSSSSIDVSYSWPDVSARLVEQEVTSKIEGSLARLDGVAGVSSRSGKGSGSVTVEFKKGVSMEQARFEVASQIRYLYPHLPEGVSYPHLSLSVSGTHVRPIMVYTINSGMPPGKIGEYITRNVITPLSRIEGVNRVEVNGIVPFEYEIGFSPEKAALYGITAGEVVSAVNDHYAEDPVGYVTLENGSMLLLKIGNSCAGGFEEIPVKNLGGRIIRLGDIATVRYVESKPDSYYRINGLNTVNLVIYPEKDINLIKVAAQIKSRMDELSAMFPPGMSSMIADDSSQYISRELRKISVRTVLTATILLLLVFAVSRSWRYLLVIFSTLTANILVAVVFYNIFKLHIHLYSLAGLTVSLGIIIDTSIIMAYHYSHFRNWKAFISILGALLTTIASLSIVFFLPEHQKENLVDFSVIIIINLIVSLFISLLFIPALLDKFPSGPGMGRFGFSRGRIISGISSVYGRYIMWSKRHKWIYVVAFILGFGIPLQFLPAKIKNEDDGRQSRWATIYNKTIGGAFYQDNRKTFEKLFGGSLRLFTESQKGRGYYRDPEQVQLYINAAMPDGCTVHQLNEIMMFMENYLSQFEEIDIFQTYIGSYDYAYIHVTFKEKYAKTGFPSLLKSNVISVANNYGGAVWSIHGVDDQYFSNRVVSDHKNTGIFLSGYNYDALLLYAERLVEKLSENRRVSEPGIYATDNYWQARRKMEFFVGLDRESIAGKQVDLQGYFGYLGHLLFSTRLNPVMAGEKYERVSLVSSQKDIFDLWNVKNNPVTVDSALVKLADFAVIEKVPSGIDIYKNNQSYEIFVGFDFIGSYQLQEQYTTDIIEWCNQDLLPLGYKARNRTWFWDRDAKQQIYLLVLIFVIIYFICSILFESLLQPLVIILMIPLSFIGLFLTFGLTGIHFDQGGFAALVFLSGIVVNAGIYVVNEYNMTRGVSGLGRYLKAYNRKIVPISLTIASSIIGLAPFLYDGKDDVFWYAFAVGTMGGMFFSAIVFIFVLPVFLPMKNRCKTIDANPAL